MKLEYFEIDRVIEELSRNYAAPCTTIWFKVSDFFMAFSFYPEKHVNVKINGECYEFLDNAYAKYIKLQAEKELLIFRLQANAIGSQVIASNRKYDYTSNFQWNWRRSK